jgi:hypothetical protein
MKKITVLLVSALALLFGSGCSMVEPHQQRLVSKPNMGFSDTGPFVYQAKLTLQTEPGSVFSGGARAAGCTSCK